MRNTWVLAFCVGCVLGDAKAPPSVSLPDCPSLDERLSATRRAIDEGHVRPLDLIIDDVLLRGEISAELAILLGEPDLVEPYLGGNRFRAGLGSIIRVIQHRRPAELLNLIDAMTGDLDRAQNTLTSLLQFFLDSPARMAVVNPVRRMLTDCGEGRALVQVIADFSGTRLACGTAALCLARELGGLAEDPALTGALSNLELDGEEGRQAFGLLIARVLRASAQPDFDMDQARELLNRVFGENLAPDSLARLDRLIGLLGELFADASRRASWYEVVTCTERHDDARVVSGMTYDLLIAAELDVPDFVTRFRQQFDTIDGEVLMADLHGIASLLAAEEKFRLPLNAMVEPLLTVPVARLLLDNVRELLTRGLIQEWSNLATEGLRCDVR